MEIAAGRLHLPDGCCCNLGCEGLAGSGCQAVAPEDCLIDQALGGGGDEKITEVPSLLLLFAIWTGWKGNIQ